MSETISPVEKSTRLNFIIDEKDATRTLIEGQHGALGKGLCELAMNAIDGGAKKCIIHIDSMGFCVIDDGAGFGDDPEKALAKFQALGSRNSEREGATFGRFGLGRTQVIPWGKITWDSGQNRFATDYQSHSGFERSRLTEVVDGCKVTGVFYTKLDRFRLAEAREELVKNLEYAEGIEIEINGNVINDSRRMEWDEETDLYKVRWLKASPSSQDHISHGCRIYNQGVLVSTLPHYRYPMGATVIAKKAIKVNIARNAPDPQCPVWCEIIGRLESKAQEFQREQYKGKQMTVSLRHALMQLINAGIEDFPEVIEEETPLSVSDLGRVKLLRDCRGRFLHFEQLRTKPLTVIPDDQVQIGESLSMLNVAVPVTHEEMRFWGAFDPEQLIDRLQEVAQTCYVLAFKRYPPGYWSEFLAPIPFVKAAKLADTSKTIIPNKELSATESAARNALQYASDIMAKRISNHDGKTVARRRIVIGECATAEGWTDSASYIAIERRKLPLANQGLPGATALTMLLLHEYTHDDNFPDCDTHGEAFYERYHELTGISGKGEIVGNVSHSLKHRYSQELLKKSQALPPALQTIATEAEQEHFVLDCGRNGLSEFSRTVLDKSSLIVNYGRSKIEVVENRETADKVAKKMRRYVNQELPEQFGIESLKQRLSSMGLTVGTGWRHDQFEELHARRNQATNEFAELVANAAQEQRGWCQRAVRKLIVSVNQFSREPSAPGMAGKIAQAIASDKESECATFRATTRPLLAHQIVGTADFYATLDHWEARGIGLRDYDDHGLQTESRARREWLKQRVTGLLDAFGDPDERKMAAEFLRDHVLN